MQLWHICHFSWRETRRVQVNEVKICWKYTMYSRLGENQRYLVFFWHIMSALTCSRNVWFPGVCWWCEGFGFLLPKNAAALGWRFDFLACALAIWACCSYFNQNKAIVNMQMVSFINCWSQSLSVCSSEFNRNLGRMYF